MIRLPNHEFYGKPNKPNHRLKITSFMAYINHPQMGESQIQINGSSRQRSCECTWSALQCQQINLKQSPRQQKMICKITKTQKVGDNRETAQIQ